MPSYRVDIDDLHTHHFRITLQLTRPAARQRLALPVWIPGSYMVREFARHLSGLQAWQGDEPRRVQALDKAHWQVDCDGRAALRLSYRVYAFDASVRAAWLDDARGFFNGSSLFLRALGREHEPHTLQLGPLPAGWRVATAMPEQAAGAGARTRRWVAADYDELVDHPFELGPHWQGDFQAGGRPHALVVSGAWPRFDGARLLADTQRVCEAVQAFWQGDPAADEAAPSVETPAPAPVDPPFPRYVFLLNALPEGQGGLEHRASTALAAPRRDLPAQGTAPAGDGYASLLSLIGHEYFHAWHVKRLRPPELLQIDYQRENHSPLLWCYEGITSYYEDLLLRRAGLLDAARYLRALGNTVNAVAAQPGRQVQSVAEASFDAWTKYYRADENTANATVSYYAKGALVALALDLTLRLRGHSLDAVMRHLWRTHGGDTGAVGEAELLDSIQAVADIRLKTELQAWVHGRDELPLRPLLAELGVAWREERPAGWATALGLRLSEGPVTGVQVRQVLAGSAAAAAGISAGDELLAVDGWRIRRLDEAAGWAAPDQPFELLLVRAQRVLRRQVQPAAKPVPQVTLALDDAASPAARERRLRWIQA